METSTLVSLVSGTWNRLPLLQDMVQSFRDNLLPGITYEIVIVDAGSTDGTIEWCKSQSDIVLIEEGDRYGAIQAFTKGGKAATGKYVLFANDDIAFFPNSVMPAIVHLENHMRCGAVAFADNRPMGDGRGRDVWHTNAVSGIMDNQRVPLIYAQVGLFRNWLGQRLNWWLGEHEEMKGAWSYGGDNSLSAQIQRYGYSVDELPECKVEDHIADDALRQINYNKGKEIDDSSFFTKQYDWSRGGIIVPSEPQLPQQDRRAARILYMPIYEPGWEIQKHPIHGKHGLRDALTRAKNKYGANHIVQEYDYLADSPDRLRPHLIEIVDAFKPDLILTQIQSPQPLTAPLLAEVKARTGATIINWNGDQAPGGLGFGNDGREMLAILHQVDLQLITNMDAVPTYEQERIKWAYWQIGYEESSNDENSKTTADSYYHEIGRSSPFDSDTHWPVVYLASLRSPERLAISKVVEEFGGRCFNPSDEYASLYNFSVAKAIYRRAKVIISDNGFTSRGFVSNRLFQALASGGGVVLQQHVEGLDELTGLKTGTHYVEWNTLDDLRDAIKASFEHDDYRVMTAKWGTEFVRENFSFDAQVAKLMALIKEKLGESEALANSVCLKYIGKNTSGFGLGNMWSSGARYEYQPGRNLYVRREDAEEILRLYGNDWERMEI